MHILMGILFMFIGYPTQAPPVGGNANYGNSGQNYNNAPAYSTNQQSSYRPPQQAAPSSSVPSSNPTDARKSSYGWTV